MAASSDFLRECVTLEEGAVVISADGNVPICEGIFNPVACYLPDNTLLIVARNAGRAFRHRDGRLDCIASFPGIGADPVAAYPTLTPGEFAVFLPNGQIRTYQRNFPA
jgi:hypothetical protein